MNWLQKVRRQKTAERGYGARWRRLRMGVLAEIPWCQVCGQPATDVDHILPKSRGGTDHRENLQSLCHSCHSKKTKKEGAACPVAEPHNQLRISRLRGHSGPTETLPSADQPNP